MSRGDLARRLGALLLADIVLPGVAVYYSAGFMVRQLDELWTPHGMSMAGTILSSVVIVAVWALVMMQFRTMSAAICAPLFAKKPGD